MKIRIAYGHGIQEWGNTMKITKNKLKQLIKEEVSALDGEAPAAPSSDKLPELLQALDDDIAANRSDIEEIFNILRRAGVVDRLPGRD